MTMKQAWVGLLAAAFLAGGLTMATAACNKKKDKEETEETTPPPEPEPSAEPTATAAPTGLGKFNVKTYPNQMSAGGTYRLLKDFFVYDEADTNSKRIGGVGRGTIITLRASLGQWLLIDWPSGPGEMSPGWIQVAMRGNSPDPTLAEQTDEKPDAGVAVDAGVDAGVVDAGVVDAGPTKTDGGKRPVLRIPIKK